MKKLTRGFTIVEVAIVIAVIAILTTMTLVVYNNVQKQSRDSKRQNDIEVFAASLEKFYDTNGLYPMGCGQAACSSTATIYFPDTASAISTSSTSTQLTALLKRDFTNIRDPALGNTNTPITGNLYTTPSTSKGYLYRGQQTLVSSATAATTVGVMILTDGGSRSCTINVEYPANAAAPFDTMAFILAYFAESSQTWQIKIGKNGSKPYIASTTTPGFCTIRAS